MPLFKREPTYGAPRASSAAILGRDEVSRALESEIWRSRRYGRFVSVVVASPRFPHQGRLSAREGAIASAAVLSMLRRSDRAGWLNSATLLVLLPDTNPDQAQAAALRIRAELARRGTARVINWCSAAITVQGEATAKEVLEAIANALSEAA